MSDKNISERPENQKFMLTPDTPLKELLERFPEIEALILELAPALQQLHNPALRETVLKATTLHRVAEMGKQPIGKIMNRILQETGLNQEQVASREDGINPPEWVARGEVSKKIDARPMLVAGEHPVGIVMEELSKLGENQVIRLISPFVPAPLIDMARSKGFRTWVKEEAPELFSTYFGH